jgi:hypothetical protein
MMFVSCKTFHMISLYGILQKNSLYHTSAIISSLVETATLPLRYSILFDRQRAYKLILHRLKGSREDISMIAAHLDWRKCSRLGQLGGIVSVPFSATEATFTELYCNFSTGVSNKVRITLTP